MFLLRKNNFCALTDVSSTDMSSTDESDSSDDESSNEKLTPAERKLPPKQKGMVETYHSSDSIMDFVPANYHSHGFGFFDRVDLGLPYLGLPWLLLPWLNLLLFV